MTAITKGELARVLRAAGMEIEADCLVAWSRKGPLPPLKRIARGTGSGRGALYGWESPDIVPQAYTLLTAREMYSRLDVMTLWTWFAGFNYPVTRMREVWTKTERRQWLRLLQEPFGGEPVEPQYVPQAIQALVTQLSGTRKGRRLPDGSLEQLVRANLDPGHEPSSEELQQLLRAVLPKDMDEASTALLASIPPEWLIRATDFFHRYMTSARIPDLLQQVSDEELEAAHADVAFLSGAYRYALAKELLGTNWPIIEDPEAEGWAWFLSRIAIRLGRALLKLDLGLRMSGFRTEVEQSMSIIRTLAREHISKDLLNALAQEFREAQQQAQAHGVHVGRVGAPPSTRDHPDSALDEFFGHLGDAAAMLWAVWEPHLGALMAGLAEIEIDEQSPSAHKVPT